MKIQKLFNILVLLAILTSFAGGGTVQVGAQGPQPPTAEEVNLSKQPEKFTQADREAAADRSAAEGFDATAATTNAAMAVYQNDSIGPLE